MKGSLVVAVALEMKHMSFLGCVQLGDVNLPYSYHFGDDKNQPGITYIADLKGTIDKTLG